MIARFAIPFFLIMGLVVVPLLLSLLCRWLMPRQHWRKGAIASTLIVWILVLYGHLVGYQQLDVCRYDFASADLPQPFDGYRVVQFSDAHVGTMTGSRQWLLQRAVDSINALKPDLIVFTGDMQNISPDELAPILPPCASSRLKTASLPCWAITIMRYIRMSLRMLRTAIVARPLQR